MTRGMIFKQWEIKAALTGAKSQKRVPIRLRDGSPCEDDNIPVANPGSYVMDFSRCYPQWEMLKSPHQAGDLVFVKEKFSTAERIMDPFYLPPDYPDIAMGIHYWADGDPEFGNWVRPKPSTNMRQEYARLWYEITGVRVERVRDISEEDVGASGTKTKFPDHQGERFAMRYAFIQQWNADHPKYPFDTSWCWVFDLKKAEAGNV